MLTNNRSRYFFPLPLTHVVSYFALLTTEWISGCWPRNNNHQRQLYVLSYRTNKKKHIDPQGKVRPHTKWHSICVSNSVQACEKVIVGTLRPHASIIIWIGLSHVCSCVYLLASNRIYGLVNVNIAGAPFQQCWWGGILTL